MTDYYADSDNGSDGNAGTSTGAAWASLTQFMQNARSAGDRLVVRRGMTNRYDVAEAAVAVASDGTPTAPIIVEADYDDAFGDHVDLSGTATATLTFGSKTVTFTADVSSVVAAGDWIYVSSDDPRDYAYEVRSVSTVTVTLWLPYKGDQAGSSKTVINMQSSPIWGLVTTANGIAWSGDEHWICRGIHARSTNVNGPLLVTVAAFIALSDCIGEGNGAGDRPASFNSTTVYARKCRFTGGDVGISLSSAQWQFDDCLIHNCAEGLDVAASGSRMTPERPNLSGVEFDTCTLAISADDSQSSTIYGQNVIFTSVTSILADRGATTADEYSELLIGDYNGTIGDTRHFGYLAENEGDAFMFSETTKVRAGGGDVSIKVVPGSWISNVQHFEPTKAILFRRPVLLTAAATTITAYFASDTTTEWTSGPTASELYIEVEYLAASSGAHRAVKRSTGTVDFTTDTDFDQSLSVTFTPTQAGLAFVQVVYTKTKESAKANIFYCDPELVLS